MTDEALTWINYRPDMRNNAARKPDCLPLGCMCALNYERTCVDANCPRQMWSSRKFSGIMHHEQ